ncbi:hypothetical protein CRUP_016995, partial [Coryphaenoides rupestris]
VMGDHMSQARQVLKMIAGGGLTITGSHHLCGDYLYSGHTVILTLCYLFIKETQCSHQYGYWSGPLVTPSGGPLVTPSGGPLVTPSGGPLVTPSGGPLVTPSGGPLVTPSGGPLVTPSGGPLVTPSGGPLVTPSGGPLVTASGGPRVTPSGGPLVTPSGGGHSPQRFWWCHWLCWLLCAVGLFCILLAHDHYSIDVV